MNLQLNKSLAEAYQSPSQQARVMTESWVSDNLYCPVCGYPQIAHFPNNKAVADFYCPQCHEQYELKSKNGIITGKVADGAYETFVQRIEENTSPDFLFMSYSRNDLMVHHLSFVPKFFFIPEVAERRKPLNSKAKRAGWTGCNILYDRIPDQGRIAIIRNLKEVDRKVVEEQVQKAFQMRIENLEARGWLFDVLHCVNGLSGKEFTLAEVYQFEDALEAKYSQNRNIRAKIRQQLQMLRDKGIIDFLGNGRYRKII